MAGKGGGGAWKVAYADFVTAMMAFFLVMWICGQDQKVRRAVSHYFQDPISSDSGISKTPNRSGSFNTTPKTGKVPDSEGVSVGRGRDSHSDNRNRGGTTKMVSDFVHENKESAEYWREQARRQYTLARGTKEVLERHVPAEKIAAKELMRQMREETLKKMPRDANPLYQKMLEESISAVNWREIAEDLLHPDAMFPEQKGN